jgi:DNA gyrase/topoisomerase IV subunit B
MKKKSYTAEDVKVLSDRDHVRLRTQVYLGNTHPCTYNVPSFIDNKFQIKQMEFIPAVYKSVNEIIDNSIDEFAHIEDKNKVLKIEAKPEAGFFQISDNGRGIPTDLHSSGKYTPEVALGSLRAGRNFTNEKESGVIGQNGVGSACTNYCSTEFDVTIYRDNKRYKQSFRDGANTISKPKITDITSDRTGTEIAFQLDSEVFKSISLPSELMQNRAIEIALTNPGVIVEYNDEKYKFKNGFKDVIKPISENDYYEFNFENEVVTMQVFVMFNSLYESDEQIFTWVNSSYLFDGGICNTQFMNSFYDHVINSLASAAKKEKIEISKQDIKPGLAIIANLKIKNPEYDAQSKTRLTGPNLKKEMTEMLDNGWGAFVRKNKEWFDKVLQQAIHRYHRDEDTKAINEHKKTFKKRVPGLLDATENNRFLCQILITEGLSAKSQISEARNPKTTAAFPLSGKVNNVFGTTPAQLLKMGKFTDLLSAIGLTPGVKVSRGDLRYGKIVIATDSDVDGSDIFTLLVNLFYEFWPELFDPDYEPIVYRLIAPNVCLVKGKHRLHFTSRAEYEKQKDKHKGYEVKYYKGLGSMCKEDWDMVLSGKTDTLIPITNDGNMGHTLELLFGPSADARKTWLQKDDNHH